MTKPIAVEVVVIGGGISGLVAAHRLQRAQVNVAVVDESFRPGGKVLSEHVDGFLIECGPDSFVAHKGSVLELVDQLGLTNRVISSRPEHRGSFVWWQDQLNPLPDGLLLMAPSRLGPLFRSSLLSWKGKARVLADLVIPRSRFDEDESLESFVVRRLGREILDRIAEPLIAGIHASEAASMSLRASFPRFLEMESRHRSLILAARSEASRRSVPNGVSYFASLAGGMGEMVDELVGRLGDADVRTGVSVNRLTREGGGGYRLRLSDGNELLAQGAVLATPARVSAALLTEIAPEAAAALAEIRQVSTSTVTLVFRTRDIPALSGSGFVVPSAARRRIMGVSYLSQKWEGRVPDPQFTMLRAFIGGRHGQELARAGAERQEAEVREELAALIGIIAQPVLVRVHSWEGGLHQYTLGHVERVQKAESVLSSHRGLALAGAAFHGIGLNECVDSGRRAADALVSSLDSDAAARVRVSYNDRGSD